jgi:uncharacterized phiE125 gp8 family phage protein
MRYNLIRTANPTVEPISLQEAKDFLRIFPSPGCDGVVTVAAIPPATYTPSTVTSAKLEVLALNASVIFNVGTVLAAGSIVLTVEESNDDALWEVIHTFTIVTPANDVAVYTYDYDGAMRYIRVSAVIATANAAFSVEINTITGDTSEDDLLENLIVLAREYCEDFQNRAFITQTWEMSMPYFPCGIIDIPKGNLQSIDSIKYKDADGVETTLAPTSYVVSDRGILGRVASAYGTVFPSFVPFPLDAVVIEFTCGYGDTALDVPERVKYAMKVLITHWYDNRALLVSSSMKNEVPKSVNTLLSQERIVIM